MKIEIAAHWQAAVEVDPTFAQGWVNTASNPDHSTESRIAAYRLPPESSLCLTTLLVHLYYSQA